MRPTTGRPVLSSMATSFTASPSTGVPAKATALTWPRATLSTMTAMLDSVDVPNVSTARTVNTTLPSRASVLFQVALNESAAGNTSAPMPAGASTSSMRAMLAPGACAIAEAATFTAVPRTVEPSPGAVKLILGP